LQSVSEALKCNSCYRRGCSTREETCWRMSCNATCVPSVFFFFFLNFHIVLLFSADNKYVERCMMRSDRGYYLLMGCSVDTCQHRDLCNDGL
uniref:Uncharacterized protein n=1 Tax=Sparus aurata TaxID=8175 RepID=A0A671YJD4_SPAAU